LLTLQGKPIDIRPEVEEICNWWAVEEGSDFASKDTVKKNFVRSFLGLFPKELGATNIEDFDFSQIKAHLLKQREIRLARSTEEKKKILTEK
jgi:DNA topoisomerase IB